VRERVGGWEVIEHNLIVRLCVRFSMREKTAVWWDGGSLARLTGPPACITEGMTGGDRG
jgi:hypothetical protein